MSVRKHLFANVTKLGATRQWLAKSSAAEGLSSETQALNQWDTAKAEGQKPGAQQVPKGRQVGDGEVVRVQTPSPHHADDEVGNIKEDGHLEGEIKPSWKRVEHDETSQTKLRI